MKPYTPDLIAWKTGFRRGHDRLEEMRRNDIRESNIVKDLTSFDLAFKSAIRLGVPERSVGLSKLERALFGIK